jgi:hypothetical protein
MRTFRSYNIRPRVGSEREIPLRGYRWLSISSAMTVIGGAIAALSALAATATAASDTPTFNQQVAPILFKHCTGCHRAGEIGAPVSLLTFESAKSKAAAIKEQVLKGTMPPWPADAARSLKFGNDARLSKQDIHVLADWADGGAPRGDGEAPVAPEPAQGWLYPDGRAPDAIVTLPEVTLAANGEVPYILQRVKVPFQEDKWIVALQVRPSNDAVVHHMGITEVTLAANVSPEQLDQFSKMAASLGMPDGALNALRPAVTDPVNTDAYDMLGVYTPGTTFEHYPTGSAKLLKGGSNLYINANIHYTTTGRPEKDRSQIAMWFQPQPPDQQLFRAPGAVSTIIANGRELLSDDPGTKAEGTPVAIPPIPPFEQDFEIDGVTAYTSPVTIFQLQPHAHMRGKSFKYAVIYPDGREITLLTVPNYDFHWQLAYDLETPLKLPAGSKLVVMAHYDNSARNPHLRGLTGDLGRNCGPDKQARFLRQNQSWDEMFSPIIQYSVDSNAKAESLPLVQTVGCLVHSSSTKWTLTRAADPHDTQTQSTAAAAIASAAVSPFGNGTFDLLGTQVFKADRFQNQKVIVKGVAISAATGNRINVTSLQPANLPCQ